LVIDGDMLYWTLGYAGLYAAPKAGGKATQLLSNAYLCALAVDADHVYAATRNDMGTMKTTVFRIAKSGGKPQILADAVKFAESLTVRGNDLIIGNYWGPILRIPKAGGHIKQIAELRSVRAAVADGERLHVATRDTVVSV